MIQFIPAQEYRNTRPFHNRVSPWVDDCSRSEGCGCVINVGRGHVCVLSFEGGFAGADDAGLRIAAAAAGSGILMPEIEDGVIRMRAAHAGLLKVAKKILVGIHSQGGIRIDSLADGRPVVKNQLVAEIWLDPSLESPGALKKVEETCHRHRPVVDILPFRQSRVGILTSAGTRAPRDLKEMVAVVQHRCVELGCEVVFQITLFGDMTANLATLGDFIGTGADMLICLGFSELNPLLISRIEKAGGRVSMVDRTLQGETLSHGRSDAVPVLWLPDSVLGDRGPVADMVVPRFLAGLDNCLEGIRGKGTGEESPSRLSTVYGGDAVRS